MDSKKIIEAYYKAFNAKDVSGMLNQLSDGVIHDTNQGTRTIGKPEFKNFLEEMNATYDENLTDIEIMVSQDGKRLAAEFICNGVYMKTSPGLPTATGQRYKLPVGCFFQVESGKITRVTNYYNMNDWLNQIR